eukprot:3406023-Amphidinium_carterae.1
MTTFPQHPESMCSAILQRYPWSWIGCECHKTLTLSQSKASAARTPATALLLHSHGLTGSQPCSDLVGAEVSCVLTHRASMLSGGSIMWAGGARAAFAAKGPLYLACD